MCRIYTIEIAGRPEEHVFLTDCVYQLPDGSRAGAIPTLAWCFRCKSFVCAEWILSIADIDSTIVELTTRPFSQQTVFIFGDCDDFREKAVADYHRRRIWRLLRKSTPKCISCGSDQIQYIDYVAPFPHPEDNSECTATEAWGTSAGHDGAILLDVEGNEIGLTT